MTSCNASALSVLLYLSPWFVFLLRRRPLKKSASVFAWFYYIFVGTRDGFSITDISFSVLDGFRRSGGSRQSLAAMVPRLVTLTSQHHLWFRLDFGGGVRVIFV